MKTLFKIFMLSIVSFSTFAQAERSYRNCADQYNRSLALAQGLDQGFRDGVGSAGVGLMVIGGFGGMATAGMAHLAGNESVKSGATNVAIASFGTGFALYLVYKLMQEAPHHLNWPEEKSYQVFSAVVDQHSEESKKTLNAFFLNLQANGSMATYPEMIENLELALSDEGSLCQKGRAPQLIDLVGAAFNRPQ